MIRAARTTRITTWGWLVVYCLVASGLPLPIGGVTPRVGAGGRVDPVVAKRLAGKDRSSEFPCMDRPCGCATAEQCFSSCCCNTPTETLAWARAHDVSPAILAGLERRAAADPPQAVASCCRVAAQPSCCDASPGTSCGDGGGVVAEPCCSVAAAVPIEPAATAGRSAHGADRAPPRAAASDGHVVLRAMLACGGIAAEWSSCGASLPPPPVPMVSRPYRTSTITIVDESIEAVPPAPDAPPPRAV